MFNRLLLIAALICPWVALAQSPYSTDLSFRPSEGIWWSSDEPGTGVGFNMDSEGRWFAAIYLLQSRGEHTHPDCVELFRRVVFNILIHNTDDHLRNHGFFIGARGISLSPAYDINPSIERCDLSLAINEVETACDVTVALEASKDYGLSRQEADAVVSQVIKAVESWQQEATRLGIPRAEQALMARAFKP